MQPFAVVFDIGNVLIEWQPERFYDSVIGSERRRAMFDKVDLHAMNDRVDRGGNFREIVYATADATPAWRDEIRMWHDRWIEMACPVIDHSVRLLRALRANEIQVFALSNFGVDSFAYAETKYPFLAEFDQRFISGHMKTAKPDTLIYEMVEEQSGLSGGQLFFVDDRADNIEAAEGFGWQTHLFETSEDWADCLVEQGLLTEEEAA